MSCFTLLALLATFALLPSSQAALPADEFTFAQVAAAGGRGQFRIQMWTGNKAVVNASGGVIWTPVNCTNATVGVCTMQPNADPNQPLQQDSGGLLRMRYTLFNPRGANGGIATFRNQTPTYFQGKLCIAPSSLTLNRPWRTKNKAYPRWTDNCKISLGVNQWVGSNAPADPVANSGEFIGDFDTFDQVSTYTMFGMLWIYCRDLCAFESTEGSAATATAAAVPGNFIETKVEMGITPGMTAAAIVLSVFSPAFFIIFYIADNIYYRKHGKPIRIN
ncbi:hypothetical protein V8C86DRAFT_3149104 [Haematococcus lacustris]